MQGDAANKDASNGLFSEVPVVGNILQAATELPVVGNVVGDIAHGLGLLRVSGIDILSALPREYI